jgi:CubicO group peptidase (beta-lactamase class C family)
LRFSTVEELRVHVGRLSHASRHLNSWVSSREIPAASLLVGRRGCFLAPLFFGHHADRADASPLRGDAIFLIASITKPIVALAALQLVERGELALDDRVERYIPHFGKQGKHGITVRHLLTHTSGLPDMLPNNLELRGEQAPLSAFVEGACRLTPEFPAGRSVQYQSLGFAVLGEIIQRVSGLTCGAWLKQHLFDPLGMRSTAFRITPDMRTRLAGTHLRGADGKLAPFPFEIPQEPEFEMGGGGLYSTMGDYLKFVQMVLNLGQLGGERVLKPETVLSLGLNHMGDCRVYELKAAIPLTNDAEFFPGVQKSWSLAFQVNHSAAPTGRPAGGLMWAGLANSYYWIDPVTGIGGVFLTQIFPFADHRSLPTYYGFETAVYDGLK